MPSVDAADAPGHQCRTKPDRVALADCEAIFRAQRKNKRIRDNAALVCRALCRARVAEELQRRRGTRIAEHLELVLTIIDRQVH
jgi:hypothetical protein